MLNDWAKVRDLKRKAQGHAGLLDEQISAADKATAMDKARDAKASSFGRRQRSPQDDEAVEAYAIERWKEYLPNYDMKIKKQNEWLEKNSENVAYNTNGIIPSKSDIARYNEPGFKEAVLAGPIKFAQTGTYTDTDWIDEQEASVGGVNPKIKQGIVSGAKDAEFLAIALDPETKSSYEYIYSVPNPMKPEERIKVRVPASSMDVQRKIEKGQLANPTTGLNGILYRLEQGTNKQSGTANIAIRRQGYDVPMNVRVNNKAPYSVALPTSQKDSKGEPVYSTIQFGSEEEMARYLYTLETGK
jgi:hypothetical protein